MSKLERSSKVVMSAKIMLMLLLITKKKHDTRTFKDCIRSDSEKGDIEKKLKKRKILFC